MKRIASFILFAAALSACSTCYECTEDVVTIDETSGDRDTTSSVQELCTADQSEIESRENDGAVCRVQ